MADDKPKRPWGGFGYLILIVIIVLVGYFIILPVGVQVSSVFQSLNNAFHGK